MNDNLLKPLLREYFYTINVYIDSDYEGNVVTYSSDT